MSAPAFADEEKVADAAPVSDDAVVAVTEEVVVADESVATPVSEEVVPAAESLSEETVESNDKEASFLKGVQIGAGVSVTGGVNGFVGYVNKDYDSFCP